MTRGLETVSTTAMELDEQIYGQLLRRHIQGALHEALDSEVLEILVEENGESWCSRGIQPCAC